MATSSWRKLRGSLARGLSAAAVPAAVRTNTGTVLCGIVGLGPVGHLEMDVCVKGFWRFIVIHFYRRLVFGEACRYDV
jgi:hypothetical protein